MRVAEVLERFRNVIAASTDADDAHVDTIVCTDDTAARCCLGPSRCHGGSRETQRQAGASRVLEEITTIGHGHGNSFRA